MNKKNILLISALYFPIALSAQQALPELVVTATRMDEKKNDVPLTVDQISATTLQDTARKTLPDALQYVPGVLVQKTANGHGSPFIRGFTGRQNLLLIDGVRLNNSTWRSGPVQFWNTVDSFATAEMELVKSQGSALYGSDSIGGTLNVLTESSNFLNENDGKFFSHGSAAYEYRSNGEGSHIGRLEENVGVGGKYGLHLGVTKKDFGDIESNDLGRMVGTGYEDLDFDARFDMLLSKDTVLTFATQAVNQDDISRWHRTLQNPGWIDGNHVIASGKWVADDYDQERSLTYLKIEQENPEQINWLQKWSATLSYQTSQDSEYQDRRSLRTKPVTSSAYQQWQNADVKTYGVDVTLESKVGKGTAVYGADYYHDDVESFASRNVGKGFVTRESARPVADGAEYDLLGVFGQYTWNPIEKWEIMAGTRFTYAKAQWDAYRASGATADSSGENSWTNFSSNLRASYNVADDWSLYGGVSQSFRAPNLSDLTGNSASLSGLDSQGSPTVDPEEFLTFELGAHGEIMKDLSFSTSVFYTQSQGDGAISSYVNGTNTYVVNAEDSDIYGIEAQAAWKISNEWTLSGYLAWQEGKSDISFRSPAERWQPRALPFTASAALRWTHPNQKVWIEGRVVGAVTADRVHPLDQAADNQRIPTNGTPGYFIPMIYAGWKTNDHLEWNVGLENAFDSDYRTHGSGQNEPGINAIVGVKATW